ncbi:DUF803 domain membrane protein [Microthyrium microscopicum]|uniref:DUF803 domain membrane protein n=1 Tax=Microthyrium microscopicum TaxID=703497 RepID=A0A6A6UMG4_9PEZI|nr:DUF803 domain membrane protein [Microthyrium microscopicum]
MVQDKYVGLILAVVANLAIGSSFVITKKGLNEAAEHHGFEGEGFKYMQRPLWWAGIIVMVIGEVANFAAYAFAPAILVTPLGALSVLMGAVLGTYFLNEKLGLLGKIGCAICLLGSIIIVLHAPPDPEIETIDQILDYAIQPGFLFYCTVMTVFCAVMIYKVAPKYGKKNPLIYLSICSGAGSVSIMAIKAFGIAVKLTFEGKNQFTHASTYVFLIVTAVCIMTQMNYFNKALSQFSTNIVNPLYYVTFTTATLCASFIMFKGFNTADAVNTLSLLCGFLVIFSGVYLLNLSRKDPIGDTLLGSATPGRTGGFEDSAIPTDSMTGFATRRSMQSRRSGENNRHSRSHSWGSNANDQQALMHDFTLDDLADDSAEEYELKINGNGKIPDEENGLGRPPHSTVPRLSGSGRARREGAVNKAPTTRTTFERSPTGQ